MKKRKPYTMSDLRVDKDKQRADWIKRIEVLTLKNQGWSFNQIARKFGTSPQAIQQMHAKIKFMTVDDAQAIMSTLE